MLIRIISNVQSFALGLAEPFIKLLHEDNNDDEGKCNDVLSKLSFSSNPSCDLGRNSPTTNTLGVIAKSSFSLVRPLVMRVICGCIKALPLPVKSFVVTSIGQLKPLVDTIASSGILDGIVKDYNLLRLTLPTESCLVVTSELVVASSTGLATINDQDTLVGIDKEESYSPNALNFVVTGCLIIFLAFGCGIIRSGTAILCLATFQVMILEYSYQIISSFVAVLMKYLIVIFTSSSSNVDLDDAGKVAEGKELAAPTLGSSSLCLDMPSSTVSNELIVPNDVSTAIVDGSNSSVVSIEAYKSCLVALLLLIFTSLVEIVDVLSVVPCIICFLPMVFTSLIDIVDTLSAFNGIDWLILITLVGSTTMFISTVSSKQSVLGSDVESTINTSTSSTLDDIGDASIASFEMDKSSTDESQSEMASNWKQVVQHPSAVPPFKLMDTLRACLFVAFLLMTCAPLLVMVAVLMVLLDFWTILQALVVATCLFHITTYVSKALQYIPTDLRGSTNALVNRVYQFNPATTMGNIITDCLLTLLLMVTMPLMGIVVIMMMLILASFNWSAVVQVLAECTMIIPSCFISVRQACGVDVTSRLFVLISFALTYYDDGGGGGVHITRGGILYTTTCTLNSIWMILVWVVKKLVYLVAYTTILLVYVIIMLVQSIDYKAVMYTSVTCLIRLPICIVWGLVGRLAGALLGCIVSLYINIKLFVLAPFDQAEQKEEPLPPPVAVAVSDDEDSDDDSLSDFGTADSNDDFDCVMPPPPPPKHRSRRRRKVYPPAVWHRGRGGRGGRLRPRKPG